MQVLQFDYIPRRGAATHGSRKGDFKGRMVVVWTQTVEITRSTTNGVAAMTGGQPPQSQIG